MGGLQRHGDVPAGCQEEGHIDEDVPHRDWLDIRRPGRPSVIGDERQGFVGRHSRRFSPGLGPEVGMDSLGIAVRPPVEVDQEQMIAPVEGVQGLGRERVAGRRYSGLSGAPRSRQGGTRETPRRRPATNREGASKCASARDVPTVERPEDRASLKSFVLGLHRLLEKFIDLGPKCPPFVACISSLENYRKSQ